MAWRVQATAGAASELLSLLQKVPLRFRWPWLQLIATCGGFLIYTQGQCRAFLPFCPNPAYIPCWVEPCVRFPG